MWKCHSSKGKAVKLTIALVRIPGDSEVGAEAVLLAVIRVSWLHFELLQNSVIL